MSDTAEKVTHSPLPWLKGGTYRTHNSPTRFWETCAHSDAGHVFIAHGATQGEAEANAEFIVTAVNHHDELIEWIRGFAEATDEEIAMAGRRTWEDCRHQAQELLAKVDR